MRMPEIVLPFTATNRSMSRVEMAASLVLGLPALVVILAGVLMILIGAIGLVLAAIAALFLCNLVGGLIDLADLCRIELSRRLFGTR